MLQPGPGENWIHENRYGHHADRSNPTGETDSDARCDDVELVPLTLCSAPLFAAWCAAGPGP
jgi:hypothetical protein